MTALNPLDEILGILEKVPDLSVTSDQIEAYLKGAAAAPQEVRDSWLDLCCPDLQPNLQLGVLKAGRAYMQRLETGLQEGPVSGARLTSLRQEMQRMNLQGLIVPRTDEYQGEYISQRAERVQWLTGFNGSAGSVVVGLEKAAIFVDGRYTLQVRDQVDISLFEPCHSSEKPATGWISETFGKGDRIGFDPWLHTQQGLKRLQNTVQQIGAVLVHVAPNPVDLVWEAQPSAALSPIVPHDIQFAGESSADKREKLGNSLADRALDAAVISATDSIAWLLNMRGGDVPNCPLPLSFAIANADGTVNWFVDERKLTLDARQMLGNGIFLSPQEGFSDALAALGKAGKTVLVDPATSPAHIFEHLLQSQAKIIEGPDPCLMPKACKNAVEIAGTRAAHRRDGAALTEFLKWITEEGPKGKISELDAIDHLQSSRAQGQYFKGASFDTIAGAGPNGAVIHYRASPRTNRKIEAGQLFLVDSGAQYLDGTTDVTRTVAIGLPSDEMRRRFTLVLKGHIALATARFPVGTTGSQLDPLARMPLWQAGLDFDHGTGHGVGSYLNVHEGPQRIAKAHNSTALKPGMILSNEPGYYKAGAYGIRIENLVVVRDVVDVPEGAERDILEFETLTLAPIDRNLIEVSMLNIEERAWLNLYHARVRDTIGPQLDRETAGWLEKITEPV